MHTPGNEIWEARALLIMGRAQMYLEPAERIISANPDKYLTAKPNVVQQARGRCLVFQLRLHAFDSTLARVGAPPPRNEVPAGSGCR